MRSNLMTAGIVCGMIWAGGCAGQKATQTQSLNPRCQYPNEASASLVFTPPIAYGQPPVLLARAPRQPSVFIGFDELSATAFYIRTDDRQSDDYSDRYHRRAVIEKIGVSYR